MAGQTPNYKLVKPAPEEFYDVTVPNGNMDKIDAALKTISDALGGIDLVSLSQAISAVDGRVTQHLDERGKHNQFMLGDVLHQIGFGYNPILGCVTYSIREVI